MERVRWTRQRRRVRRPRPGGRGSEASDRKRRNTAPDDLGHIDNPEEGSEDKETVKKLETADALKILEDNDYFNPHFLVKNEIKRNLRSGFFEALLSRTKVYQINTTGTPEESQKIIKTIAGLVSEKRWRSQEG